MWTRGEEQKVNRDDKGWGRIVEWGARARFLEEERHGGVLILVESLWLMC